MTTSDKNEKAASAAPAKEGRLSRHARMAREIYAEPKSAGRYLRDGFISVWTAHGAGFYGLGWVCAFIAIEVDMVTSELADSDGVGDFLSGQLLEYLLRFGVMSFVNGLLASIWPVYLFEWLDAWAVLVLIGGYFAFEKLLRPGVEAWLPELKAARLDEERKKAAKAAKKAAKQKAAKQKAAKPKTDASGD